MHIVAGRDEEISAWASAHLGCAQFQQPYTAFGFVSATGELLAGAVFNDYYPGGNCEWSHVGVLRPRMLQFLARFVFLELDATRVTAKTRRGNVTVRRLLGKKSSGFQFEGTQKFYFGPTKADDALVYVLFRANALRWMRKGLQ